MYICIYTHTFMHIYIYMYNILGVCSFMHPIALLFKPTLSIYIHTHFTLSFSVFFLPRFHTSSRH